MSMIYKVEITAALMKESDASSQSAISLAEVVVALEDTRNNVVLGVNGRQTGHLLVELGTPTAGIKV
ncbi:uncharacterized protein V6R79_013950 [Siganus canaliculatus]